MAYHTASTNYSITHAELRRQRYRRRWVCQQQRTNHQLTLVTREQTQLLEKASAEDRGWLARQDFNGKKGDIAWLTDGSCLIGWDGKDNIAALGHLPMQLPEGSYKFTHSITDLQAVGWGLGAYHSDRYKDASRAPARLQRRRQRSDPGNG